MVIEATHCSDHQLQVSFAMPAHLRTLFQRIEEWVKRYGVLSLRVYVDVPEQHAADTKAHSYLSSPNSQIWYMVCMLE